MKQADIERMAYDILDRQAVEYEGRKMLWRQTIRQSYYLSRATIRMIIQW